MEPVPISGPLMAGKDLLATLPPETVAELRSVTDRSVLYEKLRDLGLTKLGHRLRAEAALRALEWESEVVDGIDVAAGCSVSPAIGRPRVAFICHTGYFVGGSFGGAMRASLAMLREAQRICGTPVNGGGCDVIVATSGSRISGNQSSVTRETRGSVQPVDCLSSAGSVFTANVILGGFNGSTGRLIGAVLATTEFRGRPTGADLWESSRLFSSTNIEKRECQRTKLYNADTNVSQNI